ncbi:hypothetical protein PanWU01x14_003550 [Parasponia andersonii]|uniref:Uncharacterized protein n=1 Tax=Parasponia andersonii TaxID=3476 RepID=A0A2P5E5I5_PARAD|nr:hypothetical protein PanWU01x14_003550 [Parasponia andersonii]
MNTNHFPDLNIRESSSNGIIDLDGLQDGNIEDGSKTQVSEERLKCKTKLTLLVWQKFEHLFPDHDGNRGLEALYGVDLFKHGLV